MAVLQTYPSSSTAGRAELAGHDAEHAVSRFFQDFQDRRGTASGYLLRRPVRALATVRSMLRLPVLEAVTRPDTVEGAVVDEALAQRHTRRRFLLHASVLVLPREPGQYAMGSDRKTLRRMARKAVEAGITCGGVEDPSERRRLLEVFNGWERTTPRTQYRNVDVDNDDLLDYRRWLVARARDGRPLLLAVIPVDGAWALLRYFRTVGIGTEQTLARYAMFEYLVERLVQDGVRYVFDKTSPARLPNGLRHYQRMIGFRLFRIRVTVTPGCGGTDATARPKRWPRE